MATPAQNTPTQTQATPKPNAARITGPDGKSYDVPLNTAVPYGWTRVGEVYVAGGPSEQKFATLYGPGDVPLVAMVGTKFASDLLTSGYSPKKNGFRDPAAEAQKAQDKASQAVISPQTFRTDGGTYALVRFKDNGQFSDPTPGDSENDVGRVWLLDMDKGAYRPISGPAALRAMAAQQGVGSIPITDVPTSVIADPAQKAFNGQFLPMKYAVQADLASTLPYPEDVSAKPTASKEKAVDPDTGTIYGKQKLDEPTEQTVANSIGQFFDWLSGGDAGNHYVSKETVDRYAKDRGFARDAFLAVAYGGYDLLDVWRELKAKEDGNASYVGFSRTLPRAQWAATSEGAEAARSGPVPPGSLVLKVGNTGANKLASLPQTFFSQVARTIDPNNPEDLATVRAIEAACYDVMNQLASADTQEEYGVAMANWEALRDTIARNLNIQLSADVTTAWTQFQTMLTGFSDKNLGQSGVETEAIDRFLDARRKADQLNRDKSATEADQKEFDFVKKSGTAADTKRLIDRWDAEDAAKGVAPDQYRSVRYGLKPSEEARAAFTLENFRKLYPYFTDAQLNKAIAQYVDVNGNYASDLFHTLAYNITQKEEERFAYQQSEAQKALQAKADQQNVEFAKSQAAETNRFGLDYPDKVKSADAPTEKPADVPTEKPADVPTPPAPTGKQFYRLGTDIYEVGTNRHIGPTEWGNQWSGQATELKEVPFSSLTYISNPDYLSKYNASQVHLDKPTGRMYLKPGEPILWGNSPADQTTSSASSTSAKAPAPVKEPEAPKFEPKPIETPKPPAPSAPVTAPTPSSPATITVRNAAGHSMTIDPNNYESVWKPAGWTKS